MDKKWNKNGQKVDQKWTKSGSKMEQNGQNWNTRGTESDQSGTHLAQKRRKILELKFCVKPIAPLKL